MIYKTVDGKLVDELQMSKELRENERRKLSEFYGIEFKPSSDLDRSCHIWQDKAVLRGEKTQSTGRFIDDKSYQNGQQLSSQNNMGLASNEGKEQRLLILKTAIDYHHIKTSAEAYEALNHEVSNEQTLIQYLRKIRRNLRSSETGKILGLSDQAVRKAIAEEQEKDAKNIHYYDGDPALPTTNRISKLEYDRLKAENIKEYKVSKTRKG